MTETTTAQDADRELKARHRALWAQGNYAAVATQIIPALGTALVEAAHITDGQRVLDVAAGTGNAAIPAAEQGATVTASDLTPELLDVGRQLARDRGVTLEWDVADAENLPYEDGAFDVVVSCVGVMFAPHHQATADELLRVCAPHGTVGLINWTPEGFIGRMFATMKPYAPPPPPGAQPPPLWGREDHVRSLFGDRVTDLQAERRRLRVDHFESATDFLDYFKTNYGPTISVYRSLAGSPDRVAALDAELIALAEQFASGPGVSSMDWEYLLVTGRRS